MQINDKAAIIFLSIGLLADLVILAVSIYAVLQRKEESLLLWGKWTLLVPLGFELGLYPGINVISDINETLGFLFTGLSLGLAEWFIIRRYLKTPSSWILATTIGWVSGIALTRYEGYPIRFFWGVVLGVTQFLVIGHQYRKSAWWIGATIFGIACLLFQSEALYSLHLMLSDLEVWVMFGFFTFIYSAITGVTLVWPVRKNDRKSTMQDDMIKSVPSNHGVA